MYPRSQYMALVLAGMPFVFGSGRQHNTGLQDFYRYDMGGLLTLINDAAQNLASHIRCRWH